MIKYFIGLVIFSVVLFLYLHIQYHLKCSNDLEVYTIEKPSKEKLEEICDLRQPVIFEFTNNRLLESCSLSVLDDNYGAFDIQLRDKTNDEETELYLPFLLKEAIEVFRNDKNGKYISENNEEFLKETGVIKNYQYNDSFLRPPLVSKCIYDFLTGSVNSKTPLRYNLNYRNYFYVTSGKAQIKLIPPHNSKYLYGVKDYDNFENAGLAHLVEHIVCEGWKKCGSKGCSNYWKKRGVDTNASTGQTNIEYYMHGLDRYAKEMVDYIASISINPIITKSRMDKEKKAVQNELMIHAAQPQMNLYNLLNSMLFRIEGLICQDDMPLQLKNLKKFTVEQVRSWINRFYGSGNIIFVISGNFSKNSIISLLKNKLRKANPIKVIPKYSDIFKQGLDVSYLKNKQIENTNILFAFHAPIYQKDIEIFYIDFF